MERISAKEFIRRWLKGSFAFFGYVSSILSSMSAVFGFWISAYLPQGNSIVATIFFAISILLLIGALVIGFFFAPYRIVQEKDDEAIIHRMSDAIRVSLGSLTNICDSITRGKGEKGNPPDSRFILLEDIHDHIYKTMIKNLESVLPKEK
jgi:hypothetical protein